MTKDPKDNRHPGQVDRRDSAKARTKTDPDQALWCRLPACSSSNPEWKSTPQ